MLQEQNSEKVSKKSSNVLTLSFFFNRYEITDFQFEHHYRSKGFANPCILFLVTFDSVQSL